jgi:transcription-repair coupling factor (superfamily II helicase)
MYRKLADVRDETTLDEVVAEMTDRYGTPPQTVTNLIAVARFRLLARAYGLHDVSLQGKHVRFGPMALPDSKQMRLKRFYPESVYKPAADQVSLPRPTTRRVGGEPLRDAEMLAWCAEFLQTVLGDPPAPARAGAAVEVGSGAGQPAGS